MHTVMQAMEAMDAFAVEVLYLNDAEKKKKVLEHSYLNAS
jgi:hypothetical protein